MFFDLARPADELPTCRLLTTMSLRRGRADFSRNAFLRAFPSRFPSSGWWSLCRESISIATPRSAPTTPWMAASGATRKPPAYWTGWLDLKAFSIRWSIIRTTTTGFSTETIHRPAVDYQNGCFDEMTGSANLRTE
jgi:hypothetical protein